MTDTLRRWALLLASVLAVVAGLAYLLERGNRQAAERERDRVSLEAAGVEASRDASQRELQQALAAMASIREQLVAAREAAGEVRVVTVIKWRTKPGTATGTPIPQPPAGEPCPTCLLAVGNTAQIRIEGGEIVSKGGATAFVASGSVFRLTPGPETLILGPLPLDAAASDTRRMAPVAQQDRAWRVGLVGGASGQGWLAGVAYTQRLDLWGWRPEVVATAAGGPGQGVALVGVGL